MCGAALAGVKRPTFAQMTGFNGGGGTGVTITDYTPNFGDRQKLVEQHAAETNRGVVNNDTLHRSSNLFPGAAQEGTFTLSDGTTRAAGEVIQENQMNAYGQNLNYNRRVAYGGGFRSLIGQELTAAPQAAPVAVTGAPAQTAAVAPAAPTAAPVFGGGGGASAPKPTPKEQTFSDSTSSRRSGRNRKRLSGSNPNSTLVTGGEGVLGESNTSGKGLFGE